LRKFSEAFSFSLSDDEGDPPSIHFRYFDNIRSRRSLRGIGVTLAEAFEMIVRLGKNPGLTRGQPSRSRQAGPGSSPG